LVGFNSEKLVVIAAFKNTYMPVKWYMPVIPALERLRQDQSLRKSGLYNENLSQKKKITGVFVPISCMGNRKCFLSLSSPCLYFIKLY
jgi:hypothetical protein